MDALDLSGVWPLDTQRLRLRPVTADDVGDLVAYRSLPEVCRYVPFEPMSAEDLAGRIAGQWAGDGNGGGVIAVALRQSGRVIGDISIMVTAPEDRCVELGWVLNPADGGHGHATEAVRAVIGAVLAPGRMHRVIARVDARNTASLALARRLGMRQEAHLRENEWFKGEWTDEIDFAVLAREWPAGQASVGTRSAIESTIRDGLNG